MLYAGLMSNFKQPYSQLQLSEFRKNVEQNGLVYVRFFISAYTVSTAELFTVDQIQGAIQSRALTQLSQCRRD